MKPLLLSIILLLGTSSVTAEIALSGKPQPGAVLFGKARPGSKITLNDKEVLVSAEGLFVVGFGRDASGSQELKETHPDGNTSLQIILATRTYNIERVDGLPPSKVSPVKAEVLARIKREGAKVTAARTRRDLQRTDYTNGFIWPVKGRLSGFYGSQRVLNGIPKRPHYGLDIAAPTGTAVKSPAAGVVTLAEADLYYSGGTIIIDHGQGLSSSFLHLSKVSVTPGQRIEQAEIIGQVGATGRASGPHLDWRMNWLDQRVDPLPLLPQQSE